MCVFFVLWFTVYNEDCRMGRDREKREQEKKEEMRQREKGGKEKQHKENNNTKAAMKVMAPCRSS